MMYWISTGILSVFLAWSSYSYLFSKVTIAGIKALGIPDYLRIELAVLKLLAVIVILIPSLPDRLKEWAYVGVGLFLITAHITHLSAKDGMAIQLMVLIITSIFILSYLGFRGILN